MFEEIHFGRPPGDPTWPPPRAQILKLAQTNSKLKISIKNAFRRCITRPCLEKFILDDPQVTPTLTPSPGRKNWIWAKQKYNP